MKTLKTTILCVCIPINVVLLIQNLSTGHWGIALFATLLFAYGLYLMART